MSRITRYFQCTNNCSASFIYCFSFSRFKCGLIRLFYCRFSFYAFHLNFNKR